MPTSTIRVTDRGAAKLTRDMERLARGRPHVDVGIIGQDATKEESDGVTVADVALWAEYGLGQPQRSWLRAWIESTREVGARNLARAIAGEPDKVPLGLARFGAWAVGQIQLRIARGIAPANEDSTIAKKGSSTPLIDKGQFRSSVTSRVGSSE